MWGRGEGGGGGWDWEERNEQPMGVTVSVSCFSYADACVPLTLADERSFPPFFFLMKRSFPSEVSFL